MEFELRTLKSDDLFPMFGILSKIGFKDLKEIITPDKIKDMDFLEVFDEKQQHNELWEFYIHKLPPWDERTFEQFKHDLKVGNKPKIERPTNEQLEATIKDSYKIMQSFEIEKEGG